MLNAQNRFDLAIKKKYEIIFHARTTLGTFHSKYKRFFKARVCSQKPFKTSLLAATIVWSLNRHLVETLTDISTHDNRSHYLPSWTTHLSVYPGILLLFITVPLQSFRSQAMKTMFVRVSLSVCKSFDSSCCRPAVWEATCREARCHGAGEVWTLLQQWKTRVWAKHTS